MPSAYLQILGTDTGDSTPGVLVFCDNSRYLFNVGEGTQVHRNAVWDLRDADNAVWQRFCMEHRVKLTKVKNMFFTRTANRALGGVAGEQAHGWCFVQSVLTVLSHARHAVDLGRHWSEGCHHPRATHVALILRCSCVLLEEV